MDDSIVLFADFDSGNLARYERVIKQINQTPSSQAQNSNPNIAETKDSEPVIAPLQNQQKFDIEFNVWTRPDCEGTEVGPNPNRTWFYFGVRGGHGKLIKFNLMNLNRQQRLFEMGMLPVFKTVPGHEKWSRIYLKPTWQTLDNQFYMSFIHRFSERKDSVTYFAFCYPHSYDECQTMLDEYDKKFEYCKYLNADNCDPDTIYYHRELLCYSLDKRRIDLITISACNDTTFEPEPRFDYENLFPTSEENPNQRCLKFDQKRVYILTSRVHPGETPASFVFNGFLEFILRKDDPRAKILRKNFVFKLIPLLNPDGVSRGHYRTDQFGVNLNRVYKDPDFDKHPSIYAVKSVIVYHHFNNRQSKDFDGLNFDDIFKYEKSNENKTSSNKLASSSVILNSDLILPTNFSRSKSFILNEVKHEVNRKLTKSLEIGNENSDEDDFGIDYQKSNPKAAHLNDPRLILIDPFFSGVAFYVDLHGHAAKRGCFIYGNSIDNENYQLENVLFAKLVAFNTQHFDFDGCNFSVKNMFMKDKREGLSKDGSGRVAMHKILGLIHSYTLECSYASGRSMNTIPPAANWNPRNGAISPPLHTDLPPKFLMEHYMDVGKALAIAALDISDTNPHTRVYNSSFGSLEAVRNWIKFYMRSKNGGGIKSDNQGNKKTTKPKFPINTKPQPVKLSQISKNPTRSKLNQNEKSHRNSLPGDNYSSDKFKIRKSLSLSSNPKYQTTSVLAQENLESRIGQHRKLLPINKAKIGVVNSVVLFNKINTPTPLDHQINFKQKSVLSMSNLNKIVSRQSFSRQRGEAKSETNGLEYESESIDDCEYRRPSFYVQNEEGVISKTDMLMDKLEKIDFLDENLEALNFNNGEMDKNDLDLFESNFNEIKTVPLLNVNTTPYTNSVNTKRMADRKTPQKAQSINLILNDFNKKLIRLKRK
ncbi:unnamed protein product [Brachionus calyciflorus]|uniref:tubulin-glutamate carboxypeptidase n=1 Tax=Brachionus calyciflorus TaxID=104777 RepID=A0A814EI00_9BILA|nr:unnamed protein product [Brachionus calyciflorus]